MRDRLRVSVCCCESGMEGHQENREVEEVSRKLKRCLSISKEDKMEKYSRLIADGKNAARQGNLQKALDLFKVAFNINQNQKLKSRICHIEELLAQNDEEDEDDEFVNVNNSGLMLFRELHDKLYDYQRDGVSFLYGLYRDARKGGILADDMGLGKTIQVISFLSGMYDNELIKHTLLIMPTSLITNWTKEFAKWTPGMRVKEFHGTSKAERSRNLEKVQRRSGVIITTYTMLMNNWQQLSSYQGKEFCWDYVILDEAHKIKNTSTKTAKSAYAIPSRNRILLTGTPVQNNLREMWTLFDFACQGALLGTAKTFKAEYENPITRAREKDATPGEKALGSRMSENLMTLIKPYFLRRTKSEVQKKKLAGREEHSDNKDIKVQSDPADSRAVMPKLTRKNDLIVWTYLSSIQEDIYRQFIGLDHIKELLLTTRSPLAELSILKKLCDHPRLLSAGAIAKLGLEENGTSDSQSETTESDTNSIANVPDDALISESGKLVFLLALLERLREEGHRTLVFAHYRKVLDILQRILGNRGFKVLRLDGTVTQITERERLISLFQKDKRYSVFLLTTQVSGVGITLTAANRVVIYDPSWNPATDAQAVDRAYRIGQTENVIIYRLITCGTVEEKIYRTQVFKDSLIRQNTGDKKNPFRYFSRQELRELFTLEDTRSSSTQLQLQAMHSRHRRTDPELDEHIAHLHTMDMFGISDHDLMFSLDVNHDEALENQEEHHYIEGRVQKAQERMKAESELQMQLVQNRMSNTEAAWTRRPMDKHTTKSNEKISKNPKPERGHALSTTLAEGNLDQPGSGEENERNLIDDSGSGDKDSQQNLSDQTSSGGDIHQNLSITPGDNMERLNGSSHHEMDLNLVPPSEDRRLSVLQQSSGSCRTETSRRNSELDSLHGDFNLQLEDSREDAEEDKQEDREQILMDQSSSGENIQQNQSQSFIDLIAESSLQQDAESADVPAGGLLDKSETSQVAECSGHEDSLLHVTAGDNMERLNGSSHHEMDLNLVPPSEDRRLSVLQQSSGSCRTETSRRNSELDSLHGDFNLQLEDSREDAEEDAETEEEEQKLLSQLQMKSSFDVSKSLSESLCRQTINGWRAADTDQSMNESVVVTRKKRAAVIYDSEEEEEEEELKSQLNNSFQVLGASTPKSAASGSPHQRSRRSLGANASVGSRRSIVLSVMDDLEEEEETGSRTETEEEEETDMGINEEAEEEEEETDMGINKEAEEEEEEEDMGINKEAEEEEEETDTGSNKETEEEEEEEETDMGINKEAEEEEEEEDMGINKETEEEEEEEDMGINKETEEEEEEEETDMGINKEAEEEEEEEDMGINKEAEEDKQEDREQILMDQSSSGENIQQNQSQSFIDLTAESSLQQDAESADVPAGGLLDKSETSQVAECSGHEDSLLHVTAGDNMERLNGRSHHEMDLNLVPPSEDRRLSVLQQSSGSCRTETSRRNSELDSLHGDFNLQLEDSREDAEEDAETEEEEQKLLSQLQMKSSFDVSKSLSLLQSIMEDMDDLKVQEEEDELSDGDNLEMEGEEKREKDSRDMKDNPTGRKRRMTGKRPRRRMMKRRGRQKKTRGSKRTSRRKPFK